MVNKSISILTSIKLFSHFETRGSVSRSRKGMDCEALNADKNIKGIIHTELMCNYFSNLCNTLLVKKLCAYMVYPLSALLP